MSAVDKNQAVICVQRAVLPRLDRVGDIVFPPAGRGAVGLCRRVGAA